MIKVSEKEFSKYKSWAEECACNQVYPLSIAEGIQSGDIYVDDPMKPGTALFWHFCGFAYIVGVTSEKILEDIEKDICLNRRRRMLLMTDDDSAIWFYSQRGKDIGKRIEYEFDGKRYRDDGSGGININRIDWHNYDAITGRIIPARFWEQHEFLKSGMGYAAFDQERYCGVAFSAAVSSAEIDIGVEVDPLYRGRGIAKALVRRMCSEIIAQRKRPVWGHATQNEGSLRTAVSCGFVQKKVHGTICLKQAE